MKILQKGFNYSQDGPGNRLVYHTQGCNFRCKWCSNPESMDINGEAKEYTVDELADEVYRSRMMFFDGGGVTFTGGECTLQYEELSALLQKLQEQGIHTAIETNGSSPRLTQLAEHIDYLIIDFKHWDEASHKHWIGASNQQVKKNLEFFFQSHRQLHIRIPLIKGVNDNPDGFVAYFLSKDTANTIFEFLPYHEFGKDKWTQKYEIHDGFITAEVLADFQNKFKDAGLKLIAT